MANNLNSIALVGELTGPPQSRLTRSEKLVTRFRIAVDREFDRDRTDYFTVIAWQQLGEKCGEMLPDCVGLPISVKGKIRQRELKPKACGCKDIIYEVHADEVSWPSRWMREANKLRRLGLLSRLLELGQRWARDRQPTG